MLHLVFLSYLIMIFICLQALSFISIVKKHEIEKSSRVYKCMRNYLLTTLAVGVYYFYTYYREVIMGDFATHFVMRGIDAVVFYAMGLAWIKLMDSIIGAETPGIKKLRKVTNIIFPLLMVFSIVDYTMLLDEYYATDRIWAQVAVIISETLLGIVVVAFTLLYFRKGKSSLQDRQDRIYLIVTSVVVNFNNIWNNIIVITVFIKAIEVSMYCNWLYVATSIFILGSSLITIIYIYRKDFSPVYYRSQGDCEEDEDLLEIAAVRYGLTRREKEVVELACRGLSNIEIGERLSISQYTVKRHVHNVFEKMNVSSRMEMIITVRTRQNE